MKKYLLIVIILSGAVAGGYLAGYKVGQANERAENNADAAVELEKAAEATRKEQESRDAIAANFHETTNDLTERNHVLQKQLEANQRENQRLEDMVYHANGTADYYRTRLDSFVDGLRIVSEAGHCPGLPDSDHPAFVAETPDELLQYSVEALTDRCKVAIQLDSLIRVCEGYNGRIEP